MREDQEKAMMEEENEMDRKKNEDWKIWIKIIL
jgi:hypothetical protein